MTNNQLFILICEYRICLVFTKFVIETTDQFFSSKLLIKMVSQQTNSQKSEVVEWYSGKCVLITGGTGFMGKVLLEKLLRSCPHINKIYLLVRYKRGETPKERLQSILKVPLFDVVRKKNPIFFEKIALIEGDISKLDLGLSEEDRDELARNVSVVFHSAATVKFDEQLKYAVDINIVGTETIIQLCYTMKKLEAFIYVSTAYSNCNLKQIEEKVYEQPYDLEKLKMSTDCLDFEMQEMLKKRLLQNRPNIYSFTKAMAENIVDKHSKNIPAIILRPSIVVGTCAEPFPGWVDNLNGPAGILMATGKGLIRTLIGNNNCIADIIPVDICINILISSAWYISKTRPKNILVINCVGSCLNPITWGEIKSQTEYNYCNFPQNEVMWYPNAKFRTNLFRHDFLKIFLHVLPAKFFDIFLSMFGKKPKWVIIQNQIDSAINAMAFFTSNEWCFENKNSRIMYGAMSSIDKKIFNFNFDKLDWQDFMLKYAIGIKLYVLKEGFDTLPNAQKRLQILRFVYYGLLLLLYLIINLIIYLMFNEIKLGVSYIYKGIVLLLAAIYYYFSL